MSSDVAANSLSRQLTVRFVTGRTLCVSLSGLRTVTCPSFISLSGHRNCPGRISDCAPRRVRCLRRPLNRYLVSSHPPGDTPPPRGKPCFTPVQPRLIGHLDSDQKPPHDGHERGDSTSSSAGPRFEITAQRWGAIDPCLVVTREGRTLRTAKQSLPGPQQNDATKQ